ncbi:MAG: electron transfer flavoprotein subunit alpha/FixB family protein [Gammaproteobacteria bacterium]|nr:electron transfer flavoprotein subunit alpha/FixB family protein [Gammaproteobacteria bacterium]
MSRVLVVAEHDGSAIAASTYSTVAAAARLSPDGVDLALLVRPDSPVTNEACSIAGLDCVRLAESAGNEPMLTAIWAPQIAELANGYSHLLAPATTFGKDLMPNVAALLGVGMLSDVVAIDDTHEFRRPIYAGNAIVRIAADPARKLVATIRPTAFEPAAPHGTAAVSRFDASTEPVGHTRCIDRTTGNDGGRVDLQTAARVVAGGRGLGSRDAFALIERLAELLGAAVGASRAAIDAGWAPNELQVGQTGKIIAPSLYIAAGISGAIQHITGIKDAETIVAINRDENAPICDIADIVLVADLFDALPELIERLEGTEGLSAGQRQDAPKTRN